MANLVFTSPCLSPPSSPSPEERKRHRYNSIDYESLAEFYKEKLIILAREHASLLDVASDAVTTDGDGNHKKTKLTCPSLEDDGKERGEKSSDEERNSLAVIAVSKKVAFANVVNSCNELARLSELEGWLTNDTSVEQDEEKEVVPPKKPPILVVRVGVGVLIKDPQHPHKVFAGLRKGSHGAGTLALPGGHLEMNESWENCAAREVMEETGLAITNICFGHATNDPMPDEKKHYVTIFMMAKCVLDDSSDGKGKAVVPKNLEPHKCHGWESFSWTDLENISNGGVKRERGEVKLFGPLKRLVEEKPQRVIQFLSA